MIHYVVAYKWQILSILNNMFIFNLKGTQPANLLEQTLRLTAIPLRWLKIVSGWPIHDEVYTLLQNNFTDTLSSLELLHVTNFDVWSVSEEQQPNPVVMTAWRCNHLTELNILGT